MTNEEKGRDEVLPDDGTVPGGRRRMKKKTMISSSSVLTVVVVVAWCMAMSAALSPHGADSFTLPHHVTTTTTTSSIMHGHRAKMGGTTPIGGRFGVPSSKRSPSSTSLPPSSPLRRFDRRDKSPPSSTSTTALSLAPGTVDAVASSADLKLFFLQTLITTGVPTACFFGGLAVLVMLIRSGRKNNDDADTGFGFMGGGGRASRGGPRTPAEELYDDIYGPSEPEQPNNPLRKFLGPPTNGGNNKLPKNLGVPSTKYISVTRINDVLSSYDYSMDSATRSRSYAAAKLRGKNFDRALERAFTSKLDAHDDVIVNGGGGYGYGVAQLTLPEKYGLMDAERDLLEKGSKIQEKILAVRRKLTKATVDGAMDRMDVGILEVDPPNVEKEEQDLVRKLEREKEALERQVKFLTEERRKEGKVVDGEEDSFVDAVIEDVNVTTSTTTTAKVEATEGRNGVKASGAAAGAGEKFGWGKKKSSSGTTSTSTEPLLRELGRLDASLTKLELEFLENVLEILGKQRANAFRVAILGNEEGIPSAGDGGSLAAGTLLGKIRERPLTHILGVGEASGESGVASGGAPGSTTRRKKKNVFVADFPGDVGASQVSKLREEVTAIVRNAEPGVDEAVVVLQSGGGTVTGYGLAAAQLRRFREAGMKLTVCVEQVAASGGYMMCCVADRIVASPFAVLGSIGVISDVPNFYDRLKKEGIEFQTVTAGQYKRTITPTKKVTKEDLDKSKSDIEDVLVLFKDFVKTNRPVLDIDSVATGETWFGEDALRRKLCDEIKTKDEVMLEFVDDGCDVYSVKYEPPSEVRAGALSFASGDGGGEGADAASSLLQRPIRWMVRTVAREIRRELSDAMATGGVSQQGGIEQRYKVMDTSDAANRVKASAPGTGGGGGMGPEELENLDRLF